MSRTSARAQRVVGELFLAYHDNPTLMSDGWQVDGIEHEPERSRHIGDFIAGMTDRFAAKEHERLTGRRLLA